MIGASRWINFYELEAFDMSQSNSYNIEITDDDFLNIEISAIAHSSGVIYGCLSS